MEQPFEHPEQGGLVSQAPLQVTHAVYLAMHGRLLVEFRFPGHDYTRLCDVHGIASLTVSDPTLLEDWTCSGCEDVRQSNSARARYVAAVGRLAGRR